MLTVHKEKLALIAGSVELQVRDEWTNSQMPGIKCGAIESYSVTFGGNNGNECPDNHPTKLRVFIAWSQTLSPLNVYKASSSDPP